MALNICQSSVIFVCAVFTVKIFRGDQFRECVRAHVDNAGCGMPKAFVGILVIAIIVFIVVIIGAFIRCCILATVLADHQHPNRPNFAELDNHTSASSQPNAGWGQDSTHPSQLLQTNGGPIHTVCDLNAYRQLPPHDTGPSTLSYHCNPNYGFQEEMTRNESQPPPSYDEVVHGQGYLRKKL